MEIHQMIISLSTASFFCFVGVPVWWHTTKVYRANLPFGEIYSLAKSVSLEVKSEWNVFIDKDVISDNPKMNETKFKDIVSSRIKESLPNFNLEFNYVTQKSFSTDLKQQFGDFDGKARTCYELNAAIEKSISDGKENMFTHLQQNIVFFKNLGSLSTGSKKCHLIFGRTNLILLLEKFETQYLQDCMLQITPQFKKILYPEMKYSLNDKNDVVSKTESARIFSANGIEVAFTLTNTNPFDVIVDWNIEEAINDMLSPFLRAISYFGPHSVTSQIINFVDVGISPQKSKNKGYFYLKKKLPLLINPLQSRLNEYTSNNPILNFILYVPPISNMPLTIRRNGKTHKSFVSPRWGGVVIKNIDSKDGRGNKSEKSLHSRSIHLDIREDMKIFISQFRELIGLNQKPVDGTTFSAVDKGAIMQWEVNYLLLKETIANLKKATSTLVSLAELLGKIANIVIRSDIKELIDGALSDINKSKELLGDGKIREAFLFSRTAISSSEKAFFDHSLLALLYFPDDQKYAIYLPLFLPICVPVVLSTVSAIRFLIKVEDF